MVGFGGSSTDSKDMVPDVFRGARQPFLQGMAPWMNWNTVPAYGAPLVAPMSSGEWGAMADVSSAAKGRSPVSGSLEQYLDKSLSDGYADVENNPFYRGAFTAASRSILNASDENFAKNRSLFAAASQRPQRSSPMAAEEGRILRDRDIMLRDLGGQIFGGAAAQERELQSRAAETARTFLTDQFDMFKQNMEAQALPRLVAQYGLDKGTEMWNTRLQAFVNMMAVMAGLVDYKSGSESSSVNMNIGPFSTGGAKGSKGSGNP